MLLIFLQKFLLYGCIGIVVEVLFTGIYQLLSKNWKLTGHTYLWMFVPYGLTGLVMELVRASLDCPFYIKAFVYVPIIYGAEALSGYVILIVTRFLQKLLGGHGAVIPWNYGSHRWTLGGLINLKYFPFWFGLAMLFEPICCILGTTVRALAELTLQTFAG